MDSQYVAAVDIGTTKVVIAVARKVSDSQIEIVALHETSSLGVIKGDVRNLELASKAILSVKQQIEQDLGYSISEVVVGLSGQHISCTNKVRDVSIGDGSGLSEITSEDLERLSRETLNLSNSRERHVISILPQSYKIDNEDGIMNPVGMEGGRLEGVFSVIEGETSAIDRVKRCFERANLTVKQILLQPLASAEAVLSDDEKELGVAVIDIGGGTTDLCIYADNIVKYVSVLAIGGSNINSDIKSIGILERHVEKLKTQLGEAMASEANDDIICLPSVNQQPQKEVAKKALASIIEARMMDIVEWVKSQIEATMKGAPLCAGVVITGGGANLKNVELLFKRELGCSTRIAHPVVHLSDQNVEKYSNPKYSTIVGMLYSELKDVTLYSQNREVNMDAGVPRGQRRNRPQQQPQQQYDNPYYAPEDEGEFYEKPQKGGFFKRIFKKWVDIEEV